MRRRFYSILTFSLNPQILSSAAPMSVEVYHKSESGVLSHESSTSLSSGDDLPCSLCDQLVKHLKDILVANTTQAEFKQVLEGKIQHPQTPNVFFYIYIYNIILPTNHIISCSNF